jgi:hypothetical protein
MSTRARRSNRLAKRAAAGVAQVEQRHRHHGQQRNRRLQSGRGRELHVFGGVMHDQHRSRGVGDLGEGVLPGGGDDRAMGHLVGIAESVEGTQIGRGGQLVGKRAAGMSLHQVERLHQSRGASPVSELCVTEDRLTQIDIRFVCQRHGEPLLRGREAGEAVIFLRTCLLRCPLWTSIVKTKNPRPLTHDAATNRLHFVSSYVNRKDYCNSYSPI